MFPSLPLKYKHFIAVKIVHKCTHIFHKRLSLSLQLQTVPKKASGLEKRKSMSPQKMINDHASNEFGELAEFYIFGGIVEPVCELNIAYEVQYLVFYAFPLAKFVT
ncbi:hypothetical protein EON65_33970 [archaeon]|nr:MAG: hypothetical protein EON65_33970 [archaeon]